MMYRSISPNYVSFFDQSTGQGMRIKRDSVTGELLFDDPFMADFPELIDVGIMGHCNHGKSGLCKKAGIGCYQNGATKDAPNMALADFIRLAEECDGRTYQFALGGCGDPDEHEHFEDILKISRHHNIIPNFTTLGLTMTKEKADICRKYCGAVAVSWYRSEYTLKAIRQLCQSGVKTNIPCSFANDMEQWQVDLRSCSIEEAWKGDVFTRFRDSLKNSCKSGDGCYIGKRELCMGGCPAISEIVLCPKNRKISK